MPTYTWPAPIVELLERLESSPLGHVMRDGWVWTYSLVNLGHIIGIALLFGAIAVLDLRLIGLWRSIPLVSLSRPLVPVAAVGLLLAIAAGVPMFAAKASEYAGNPFLALKFLFIPLALVNLALLHFSTAWKAHKACEPTPAERRKFARHGAASLILWLAVIACGRMIAYW